MVIFPCSYMCGMSDDDLRQAGSKGVTEVVMSLIKESNPIKALFDKEYLRLSFKYFSCSTLKIRLAGLQQLNVRALSMAIGQSGDVILSLDIIKIKLTMRLLFLFVESSGSFQ